MWLSEQTARSGETAASGAVGVVTIGGKDSAVAAGSEVRGVPVASPGGMVWLPAGDREVVTLRCDSGTSVVLGVVGNPPPAGMEPGDVYLYTEHAAVFLKNNGEITLHGTVNVEGSLTVEGVPVVTGGVDNGTETG